MRVSLVFLLASLTSANAQATFDCDKIITSGLREYRISADSTSFLKTTFDKYCSASGETKESGGGIGIDTIVKTIPVKFTGSYNSSSQAMTNFCKTFAGSEDYKSASYSYAETIASKAFDTYAQCTQIASQGLSVSHQLTTPGDAQIFLKAGMDKAVQITGVYTSGNISCQGNDNKGKVIKYAVSTTASSDKSLHIFCTRKPRPGTAGSTVFDEGTVAIGMVGHSYNVFWPKSEILPEDVAERIKTSLNELRLNIEKQASRKNTVAGKATNVPANDKFGGASAKPLNSACAEGEVMTGINFTMGGTCSASCNPDGRPVSTFEIQCSKLELK